MENRKLQGMLNVAKKQKAEMVIKQYLQLIWQFTKCFPHSIAKLHPRIGEAPVGHGAYAGTAIGLSGWGPKMPCPVNPTVDNPTEDYPTVDNPTELTNRLKYKINLSLCFIFMLSYHESNILAGKHYLKFSCSATCKKLPSNSAQLIPVNNRLRWISSVEYCHILLVYKRKKLFTTVLSDCPLSDGPLSDCLLSDWPVAENAIRNKRSISLVRRRMWNKEESKLCLWWLELIN
jgi:hypothetical protein